jgi:xanthine dehydrogenase YagS FAD-binding subunit
MRPFEYARADDADSAVALVAERPSAMFLGGGTNLVDLMRLGVETPDVLVDVTRLGHDRIDEAPDGGLRIGAAVKNSVLAAHPLVRERYPVLAQALLAGASGQLRNAATVGGNLLQRTRCLYFQDAGKPCNKREPGTGCSARTGEHHNLAILGASESCIATHPSDMAVALVALDARLQLRGPGGTRELPVSELHRLPGDHPERDTVIGHGELIEAVELPPPLPGARSVYRKVRERASFTFALASVAALVQVQDGVVQEVRLALGAVAHVPWRARTAEQALFGQLAKRDGQLANEDAFARAIDAELAAATPLPQNAYKLPLVRNLVVRTLADLVEGRA